MRPPIPKRWIEPGSEWKFEVWKLSVLQQLQEALMPQIDRLTPQESPLSSSWKLYQPHHVSSCMLPPSSPVSPRVSLGLRPPGFSSCCYGSHQILYARRPAHIYGARMKGCNKASSCYLPSHGEQCDELGMGTRSLYAAPSKGACV
jgi:hypothetical protein